MRFSRTIQPFISNRLHSPPKGTGSLRACALLTNGAPFISSRWPAACVRHSFNSWPVEPAKLQSIFKLRVHSAQTLADRSILDRQYGHSFCGRPARLINKNIGPKTTACGIEASSTKIARPGLADLQSRTIEPINPSPLQIKMYRKKSIECYLRRSTVLVHVD